MENLSLNQHTRGACQTIRKQFILQLSDNIQTSVDSKILTLEEPLVLNSVTDVYLEYFMTYDALPTNDDAFKGQFVITINEFEIQNYSNKSHLKNKIIIPNLETDDDTSTTQLSGEKIYITTLAPKTLSSIKITITDSNTTPATMFADSAGDYTIKFNLISRDQSTINCNQGNMIN